MCHFIIITSLATFISVTSRKPLSNIIVVVYSNKIMKNHYSNNNGFLNVYIIARHIFQILPNTKSLLYDRTK